MTVKRKPTLKQVFNAWLKYNKKTNESYKAKVHVDSLANQCEAYATELIEHEGIVYRVSINKCRWENSYEIKKIANSSELPTTSSGKGQ
jgi:hypothetical protein